MIFLLNDKPVRYIDGKIFELHREILIYNSLSDAVMMGRTISPALPGFLELIENLIEDGWELFEDEDRTPITTDNALEVAYSLDECNIQGFYEDSETCWMTIIPENSDDFLADYTTNIQRYLPEILDV